MFAWLVNEGFPQGVAVGGGGGGGGGGGAAGSLRGRPGYRIRNLLTFITRQTEACSGGVDLDGADFNEGIFNFFFYSPGPFK